jgi:AraC-like DNA-binding protein
VAVLFDTKMVDPAERAGSWSDAHERIFFPIGVRFAAANESLGEIQAQPFGSLGAYRVVSDPSVVRRTRAAIRASDPEQFLVATPLRGHTVIEQEDRMSVFGSGDLSSWDSSHPFSVTHTEAFDLLLLVVPRILLGPRRDVICHRTAGRIAHSSTIGALAAPFFRQVWMTLDAGSAQASQEDLADGVIALVRALHHAEDSDTEPAQRLPGSALLPQLKAYVDSHLGDPQLGPESIARAHYISTRYLHKLFAKDGITVSEWVRHRRLEACRRDLRDPAFVHETVSEVARRWALSNPAHFSRIFRDAYGCTPSDLRSSVPSS